MSDLLTSPALMKYIKSHMKKMFLLLSLVLITAWIAGVFYWKMPGVVHIFLFLAVIFYLRSLMLVETPVNSATKLESTEN